MSIPNMGNKIKGVGDIEKTSIIYLFIILGVAISAFGLGRLSVDNKALGASAGVSITQNGSINTSSSNNTTSPSSETFKNSNISQSVQNTSTSFVKRYVASKNGKLYYTADCSGAKRIATKNELWFSSASDAEKSGYKPSPSCK